MQQVRFRSGGVELVDVEPGPLAEGWVRLAVSACGICGSDLHMLRGAPLSLPDIVPGHEIAGVVVDGPVGLDDAIYAVEPRVWCGSCDACITGSRHHCSRGALIGFSRNGGLAESVDVPVASLHRVPNGIDAVEASLAEPLAVCVRALHLADPRSDSRVLILGGGSIGLLCGLLARDRVQRVAVTGRHPHQRDLVRQLGMTPLQESEADAWALSHGPDVVIETVGGEADTLDDAVRACRVGGRVVVLGVFRGRTPVNALLLMYKELRLIGSNTYGTTSRGSEFAAAVEQLSRYPKELASLRTHSFPLSSVGDAFVAAGDKRSGAVKVTVVGKA